MFPKGHLRDRFASASFQILCGRALQFGSQLALVLLLPRFLPPEEFVLYSLIMPLGYLLGSVVCGWITGAVCRFAYDFLSVDAVEQRDSVGAYFAVTGILSGGMALLLWTIFESAYGLVPLILFASSVRNVVLGVLNAAYRARAFFRASLAYSLPTCVFLSVCGLAVFNGIETALLVFVGLETMVGIAVVARSRIRFWNLKRLTEPQLGVYFSFGAPLVFNAVANWLLSLSDRYFLNFWTDTNETANYVLSYQLGGSVVNYIAIFYLSIFAPRALAIEQERGLAASMQYVYAQARLFLCFSPLLFAGCTGLAVAVKALLYPAYAVEGLTVAIIVGSQLVNFAGHFYFKELELTGKTAATSKAITAAALVNAVVNIVLIPLLGANGAAVSTLLGYLTFTLVMFAYCAPAKAWR